MFPSSSKSGPPPPPSKVKLDELFFYWISLRDTQKLVRHLLEDLKAGRPLPLPDRSSLGGSTHLSPHGSGAGSGPPQAPYSPTKSPFSPHSPYATSSASGPALSPSASAAGLHAGQGQQAPPRSPTARSPSRSPPRVALNFDYAELDRLQVGSTASSPTGSLGRLDFGPPSPHGSAAGASQLSPALSASSTASAPSSAPVLAGSPRALAAKRKREVIPQFYFPAGRPAAPPAAAPGPPAWEKPEQLARVREVFGAKGGALAEAQDLLPLTKGVAGLPSFLNPLLFARLGGAAGPVSEAAFLEYWRRELGPFERAERLHRLLRGPGRDYFEAADLKPVLKEILASHPGLEFLEATPEFQERYQETVIIRIMYGVNRSGSGRVTLREVQRSRLPDAVWQLDEEEDVNVVTDFFSYEHFYVIYCKFWELDTDHNFLIDRKDLARYGNHALTYLCIERLFAGAGRRISPGTPKGYMAYEDFVWFLLSEEDKATETALEYWFRVADLDGRGFITAAEMRYFYTEQAHRMECLALDAIPFEDVVCQLFDMVHPRSLPHVTLKDVKRCKTSPIFFNVLFNLTKFLSWEQRDPFLARQESAGGESAWDAFARAEYARLCMDEEQAAEEPRGEALAAWHESPL